MMYQLAAAYQRLMAWLDEHAFPQLVMAVIFPITIVFDVLLLPLLIIFNNATALVLLCNGYLNVSSCVVASIILREDRKNKEQLATMQTTQIEHHQAHQTEIAALHDKLDRLLRRKS